MMVSRECEKELPRCMRRIFRPEKIWFGGMKRTERMDCLF